MDGLGELFGGCDLPLPARKGRVSLLLEIGDVVTDEKPGKAAETGDHDGQVDDERVQASGSGGEPAQLPEDRLPVRDGCARGDERSRRRGGCVLHP